VAVVVEVDMHSTNIFLLSTSVAAMLGSLAGCYADHSPEAMALGRTKPAVKILCLALQSYREDHKSLPDKSQSLEVLIEERSRSPANPALMDGWKRPLRPLISGSLITGVSSVGPNGRDEYGAGDDISCKAPETPQTS